MAVGEYVGGQGFPLPNPVSMHREYPRSRLWIEWCMQLFKKQRYLARDFKALRCRIRYNPESIRGVVVQTISCAVPAAIRTCSTPTGTMMVVGSTPTMTDLTTTGTTMVVSRSLSRKLVLKPKTLWTTVLRNLVLSPVPIRRSGAKFFI